MPRKGQPAPWLRKVTSQYRPAGGASMWTGHAPLPHPPPALTEPLRRAKAVETEEYIRRLRAKFAALDAVYDRALAEGTPVNIGLQAAKQIEDRVLGAAKQVVEQQQDTRTLEEIMASIEAKRRALDG